MHILLVQTPHTIITTPLLQTLSTHGYTTDQSPSIGHAIQFIDQQSTGLIMLLLGPFMQANTEAITHLREHRLSMPLVVIAHPTWAGHTYRLLELGADEVLVEPIDGRELGARIKNLVRRLHGFAQSVISVDRLRVNLNEKQAYVDPQLLALTNKEYAVLEVLALRAGSHVSKRMLLNSLYSARTAPAMKIIDVFVCKLRKKIADAADGQDYIVTVWGRGYSLRPPSSANYDWKAMSTHSTDAQPSSAAAHAGIKAKV